MCFFIFIVSPLQANAGAWGVGAFENDTALDWLSEGGSSENSLLFLQSAIDAPVRGGFIDSDICSSAIAAAELVAIIFSAPYKKYDKEIVGFASKLKPHLSVEAVPRARKAVAICAGESGSELKQLWGESKEWSGYIDELQLRLKSALNK